LCNIDLILTDPYDVIRLFPNLLPQSDSDYGEEILEKEMEIKIVALIEYLTEVIRRVFNLIDCISRLKLGFW
jgi:hypothetical protein